ncbi:probable sugar phosphate/phosphate translocator At5g05820 [Phalaenopsis equestris]|uniref:probable sugar phosphate/phosphate translocator At5g05820 n=1 Tax=Phalaenopsis equestris TaxID=78828 RepID=UPI0009E2D596|nr:probable sugar phosphate/phosphate translocator At5g05820 [Phalaenopsis equestris]
MSKSVLCTSASIFVRVIDISVHINKNIPKPHVTRLYGGFPDTCCECINFTVGLVISWYSSNLGVLLLNKYLLSNYGFKVPIFLTMCHMMVCSLLSYVAIAWLKLVPMQAMRSRLQFIKIAALSFVFCGSVISRNISLCFLPVSFNQAVGATTPFFTAVFVYTMTLRLEAWITYVTLVPVVTDIIIASEGEPSFHLFGFIMCIGATAARALKSVFQEILLSSEGEKLNSMNLLLFMASIAVVISILIFRNSVSIISVFSF